MDFEDNIDYEAAMLHLVADLVNQLDRKLERIAAALEAGAKPGR